MSYLKVIALGALGNGEVWSCGLNYRYFELFGSQMSQSMLESTVQRIITAVTGTSLGPRLRALMSSSATLTGWRVEQHDEDESINAVAQNNYGTAISGTGTATKTPQDSCVISLRTDTPGATGRGRIFWPALGATLSAAYKLTTPAPADVLTDAKALFKLIGDQLNAELAANSMAVTVELAVRSPTNHVSRKVVRLQAGDVLDTQRRRRDKIVEAYAATTYP